MWVSDGGGRAGCNGGRRFEVLQDFKPVTAYRPVLDGTGRYAVIGCKLKQNANEGCNSCATDV